ncbi:B-box zinc finger protein 20-like [Tripterygium wilfordii]|uniref:B-box zinc finger protein 20-like n=1 Tax=Tripterygium wilfordii TaxID=458696 RepID=A0A7J7DXM6_TRIWF|nr:B-box zinc finger protein 20-like [Tripterygium wilfordii]KAF5751073.1 B-box zinc finger protein 20-like [Tripterygium wilfordii]
MKICCDVCGQEEASVFCSSDEAALCDACDHQVHHANKLASKHTRFSLLQPTFKESPLCDICQERRAHLFCQEDRAILCRECDLPIHNANEYTQKHNRFLLTGVKAAYTSYAASSSFNGSINSENRSYRQHSMENPRSVSDEIFSSPSVEKPSPSFTSRADANHMSDTSSVSTSSISEYLMDTLPGWRVDDFLDPSSAAANNAFCQIWTAPYM